MKPFEWARQRRTGAVLAVGTAGSLLFFMAAVPASGATHQPSAKVAVPQGIGAAALKNAGVFTPGNTPETVAFILKARNRGILEARVEGGMRGGFLSVRRFARNFGQTPVNIFALEKYLARFGIKTSAYADRLDVTATGTADQFNKALSVTQHEFTVPAVPARNGQLRRPAMKIHGTTQSPLLPRRLARFVQAILGLTNYPTAASNAVRRPALAKGVKPSAVQTGALTPEDFAKQYNLTPLQKVAKGRGVTIGIVTLASVDPADP